MMKKTNTWTLCRRSALARIIGRIRIIDAPVVPRKLALTAPKASSAVLVFGVPIRLPTIRMPPATTNSEKIRMMNGRYSSSAVCASACAVAPGPTRTVAGTRNASAQNSATLSK